jgi:site-specific DNA recombinase
LTAAEHDLARTGTAIDRYLAAFENGTLDPEDLAPRLAQLRGRSAQLRARRDDLVARITAAPTVPAGATLRQVAEHVDDILRSGTDKQRKALIEALVAQIKITGPDRIVPVFRIPRPADAGHDEGLEQPGERSLHTDHSVRALTNLVELRGLEPLTPCLQSAVSAW